MTWRWAYEPPPADAAGLPAAFPTQGEAESWLGEFFPDLWDRGVKSVTLYEADRRVYGPMGLDADAS